MNSFVNVQVRVLAGQAMSQLAAMQAQLNGMQKGFNNASRGSSMFGSSLGSLKLDAFGSKVQWVGRQLEYNFTLPILAASGAAMKMALDNETAMKRVEKVYGDASHGADMYKKEIASLRQNFVALSNAYGVNQKEVLDVAASWAAAGASGLALAKSVDLTMQTMILGEMDAASATEALIAIQAQYGQNVKELTHTIGILNMVENETGISLQGLVQGFARAAGVARSGGVTVRELAASLAALVPATGSAAQAGNALKTIYSRLLSPTEEMVQVFKLMGIEYTSNTWKSATLTEQLHILAQKFQGLSDKQKGVVSSVAASRWQVNKFEVLMRDLLNTHGYYQRAINSTAKDTKVYAQIQKELNTVLDSNPRKLQIMWTTLKNGAADIIQPMIPMLLWLVASITKVVTAFSNLSPGTQKFVVICLLLLAAVGPIVRMFGAFILLINQLAFVVNFLLAPFRLLIGLFFSLVKVPVMLFIRMFGAGMAAGITSVVRMFTVFSGWIWKQVLLIAAQIGIGMGMGMSRMAAVVSGILIQITALFGAFWRGLQAMFIAGARALGVVWRAGLAAIAAIQRAWAMLMAIQWRVLFSGLLTVVGRGLVAVLTLFRNIIPAIRAASLAIAAAFSSPWVAAAAVVIVIILAFWKEIQKIWKIGSEWVVKITMQAFNALPGGIKNALIAVVTLVQRAAMAVYNAFSWMNPWAHHSPSLVENVTSGMAAIKKQFSGASAIVAIFNRAGFTLESFGKAVERLKRIADLQEIASQRKDLAEVAASAIPQFNKLVSVLFPLKDLLKQIGDQVARQQSVVDGWKSKLDAANAALDRQQAALQKLQDVADKYQQRLSDAQARLDKFASTPIKGMKAMSDAIFNNEMQQKKLRLEMMKMEDAVGPLDKLQGKIDAINGQIEMLSGEQNALRSAGAGSEILKYYDDQIGKLDEQQKAIQDQAKPLQDMSDALDELARKGEMLDLENSLKFDPLKRQIDDAANSMKELPFDQILAGVISNKAEVEKLTAAYNNAKAAVDAQQAAVDAATAARDAIQAKYDAESAKLQKLQDDYSAVEAKVRDVESALNDMTTAAKKAAEAAKGADGGGGKLSPGAQNFLAGAGGNFPDPGGFSQIGREGGIGDQSKLIDDFTKEMQEKTKNMFGMFDFLEPVKKAWNTAWGWLKTNVGGMFGQLGSEIKGHFGDIGNPFEKFKSWVDTAKSIGKGIMDAIKMVWDLIGPNVVETGKQAWAGLKDAFKDIQPEIAKFRDLIKPAGEAIGNVWKVLKPILMVIIGIIAVLVKALWGALSGAIGPFFRAIGDLIAGIIKIIRGILEFIIGVFTGDWAMAWTGIKDIFSGIWQAIWGVIKNMVNMIWGAIKGFFKAIWDAAVWLWDELVGHSIIPDMVNGIIQWFKNLVQWGKDLWNTITLFIKSVWDNLWAKVIEKWNAFKANITAAFITLKAALQATWNALKDALKAAWDWVWNQVKSKIDWAKDKVTTTFNNIKTGATIIWNNLKTALKSAWDWVWDQIKSKIDWAKDKINGVINAIKGFFDNLKKGWQIVVDDIKKKVDDFVDKMRGIKDRFSFSGLFDGMKSAFKSAINWIIEKWNNLSFPGISVGGAQLSPSIGTPDIGYLAKGGMIASRAMAVVGEGRRGYPEYVIPTDPMHRRRATMLYGKLGSELGVAQGGGAVPQTSATHSEQTHLHFHGDLVFPNIKTTDDADQFIRHLESLAGGGGN